MSATVTLGRLARRGALAAERRLGGLHRREVQVDGFDIVLDEAGQREAETVLLLHGYTAEREVWSRFARRLGGHHVVVPDLPGHGETGFVPGAGYSAPEQAERMLALLDRLEVSAAHVVGNSMGGFIAATMAHRRPDRLLTLGLVDAAGITFPAPSTLDRLLDAGEDPFLVRDRRGFEAFYRMTMARPPFVPGPVRAAVAVDYVARRAAHAEIRNDFADRDLLDDHLPDLGRVPTWVAWGALDQLTHVSGSEVWGRVPGSEVMRYDDLGHMPMLEDPRRTARDYRAFLDRVAAEHEGEESR